MMVGGEDAEDKHGGRNWGYSREGGGEGKGGGGYCSFASRFVFFPLVMINVVRRSFFLFG